MHYRARAYSPRQMRFVQMDPRIDRRHEHHYRYSSGRPIDTIDPTGEQQETPKKPGLLDWLYDPIGSISHYGRAGGNYLIEKVGGDSKAADVAKGAFNWLVDRGDSITVVVRPKVWVDKATETPDRLKLFFATYSKFRDQGNDPASAQALTFAFEVNENGPLNRVQKLATGEDSPRNALLTGESHPLTTSAKRQEGTKLALDVLEAILLAKYAESPKPVTTPGLQLGHVKLKGRTVEYPGDSFLDLMERGTPVTKATARGIREGRVTYAERTDLPEDVTGARLGNEMWYKPGLTELEKALNAAHEGTHWLDKGAKANTLSSELRAYAAQANFAEALGVLDEALMWRRAGGLRGLAEHIKKAKPDLVMDIDPAKLPGPVDIKRIPGATPQPPK